jgi:hypothetical protein
MFHGVPLVIENHFSLYRGVAWHAFKHFHFNYIHTLN